MNRPYIICHILSALDGKITGPFMETKAAQNAGTEYACIRDEYQADAWLYGTKTTKEFTSYREPVLDNCLFSVPEGDFIAQTDASLYYISIDAQGEIGWESDTFKKQGRPDAHIIEVLTETAPQAYRSYLRQKGISYIIAGKDMLDCRITAEKLYALFGIKTMLICGGGTVNWTFLQQGMVNELSLMLAPVADGSPDTVTVFERMPFLPKSSPVQFRLKKAEPLEHEAVRLLYVVK